MNFDSGSFRDRSARVFTSDEQVYRTLSAESYAHWQQVSSKAFFQQASLKGQIVRTEELSAVERQKFSFPGSVAAVLKH